MKTFPNIPFDVSDTVSDMIKELCPISQIEIVDDDQDTEHRIYKYVGLASQKAVIGYMSGFKLHYYRDDVVSLYEDINNNMCVFWHDGVLVVMISTTEDQHDGVMNHYGDAAVLLTQVNNSHIICQIMNTFPEEEEE
jgi:hypothetical protein